MKEIINNLFESNFFYFLLSIYLLYILIDLGLSTNFLLITCEPFNKRKPF